jgi:hypothetical protein
MAQQYKELPVAEAVNEVVAAEPSGANYDGSNVSAPPGAKKTTAGGAKFERKVSKRDCHSACAYAITVCCMGIWG